ncbi:MAG: RluA family pseudouridine synthase [Synechococcaceae cyanobacterium]|nr:RluA family pseudouridine synthase [Synechococcaceae cyanobacterium]
MDWLPAGHNGGWTYRDRVPAAQAGISATAFYALRHRHSEAAVWARRLAAGEIARNGETLRRDVPLQAGDRLAWRRPPWLEQAVPAAWAVIHDDGDLLVIDKPSGLPVLPAGGWLEHTVLRLLERRHRGDPAGVPRPVHRLGRFTSGLLVCARRPATRAWLSAALRESTAAEGSRRDAMGEMPPVGAAPEAPEARAGVVVSPDPAGEGFGSLAGISRPSLRKLYRALLVPGALDLQPGASMTISTPIGRRPHARLGWIWCAAPGCRPGDLQACSVLTLLERRPGCDLVQVAIGSGRPHQIRIHCASVGAPLLGDPLYRPGGLADPAALPGEGGYRLQAWRLELQSPAGERWAWEVPRGLDGDLHDGEACRSAE